MPRATPPAHAVSPADAAYTFTIAPFVPDFDPPAPGSYTLPVIDRIGDHRVLDSTGRETRLAALTGDRVALIAFVYTTCGEATGCPLAGAILHRIDRQLAADPSLARRVRLVTLSFDPERDTPERMAAVRGLFNPQTDWAFLTTADAAALQPILDDFGQPVARLNFEDGTWTGLFRHVLKVFLVDERGQVRNIYSTGMISPELILADLQTLSLERSAVATPRPAEQR
jgi:cytochrome c peroxidase